jgi:hypothetical protein
VSGKEDPSHQPKHKPVTLAVIPDEEFHAAAHEPGHPANRIF